MKTTILNLVVLGGLPVPLHCLALVPAMDEASPPQATSKSQAESPRLRQLKTQLAAGDRSALGRFWEAMATEHTPLVEPIPNEPRDVLVTFLWRAAPGTTSVQTAGGPMTRLLETDLWYSTLTMDPR